MVQEKGLAVYKPDLTVTELRQFAMDFAKSGYFQDAKEAVQAVVKIQAGRELGFGPVYSMTKIYIVKGKIAVSAETMGAMIKRTGRYDYRVSKYTDEEVELIFTDSGKDVFTSKFTLVDAKKADLIKSESGWAKWPRAMLMSKALSQGARIVCPHVISGTYTPEDFGMEPDSEGGYKEPKAIITKVKSSPGDVIPAEPLPSESPCEVMITDAQVKKIHATGKEKGLDHGAIGAIAAEFFPTKTSLTQLTRDEAGKLIEAIECYSPEQKPEANTDFDSIPSASESHIDTTWLKESLEKIGKSWSMKTWTEANFNIIGKSAKEVIDQMSDDQKKQLKAKINEMLELCGAK